jgi:hypothetical protein
MLSETEFDESHAASLSQVASEPIWGFPDSGPGIAVRASPLPREMIQAVLQCLWNVGKLLHKGAVSTTRLGEIHARRCAAVGARSADYMQAPKAAGGLERIFAEIVPAVAKKNPDLLTSRATTKLNQADLESEAQISQPRGAQG